MAAMQATKNVLTLKGSVEIVSEFFDFSINSILYQRGIYAPETFERRSNYGLAMMVTKDPQLEQYLKSVLKQMETWLATGELQQVVVVVNGIESGETLERWVFQVETAVDKENSAQPAQEQNSKSTKEIKAEISALLRQITATVTFLPLLDEACAFDILMYTDKNSEVPATWADTDARIIENGSEVRLRSFDTKIHKVDTAVSYREAQDDEV